MTCGKESRAEVEEATEDVVLHAGDFAGLLGPLPGLTGKLVVEVELLVVIDDAEGCAGDALVPAAGDVAVGESDADACVVEERSEEHTSELQSPT